jgi:hypothetical protein
MDGAVAISPTQIPNIVDPGPICLNSGMVALSATPAGGLFYGTGVSGDLFDPAVAGIGAHSIYYAFVNGNGCEEKDTLDIIVWPALQDSIDADQRICEGGTAIVNAYGGLSYLWSNGATTSSIAVNPTQTTTYTVLITGLGGCSKQQSVTVLVDPLPLVSVSGATTVCLGASTQLILSGAQSYSWSPSIGVSDPISSSPVLNPLQTTVYTITAVGPNGCIASTTVTVTVISPPNVFAGNDIVSCGLPVTLTATSSSNLSYVWNNGQATSTLQVNPAQTTTYSVTGTDSIGCFASDSVTVYRPSVVMGSNQAICEGDSASLSVSLTSAPASILNLTYSWSPTAGLNDPQVSNPLASPTTTTIYTVQVTDQISGCTFSGQIVVFIIPKPVVDLGADFSVAPGSSSNLIPLVQNAGLTPSYTWSLLAPVYGSLSVSNAHNTQFLANSVVPGLVTQGLVLSVMSSSGCVATDTLNITIDPSLGGYSITGYVHYPNQAQNPVNEGFVYAYGPSGHYSVVPIGPSGIYLMNGMRDSTYTLKAKITKAWGGVTVADAQLINDNVIFSGLTGIYRACADVTGDNRFLANDAQQTARRAADLPINNSFDDGSGPGNWFEKSSTVIVNGANINQNLLVISYGDVNASYGPALRNATTAHLSHNGQSIQDVKANELLVWPVYIDHPLSLGSYQIEFNVPEGYRIESILNELSNGYFLSNVKASHAKVLWYKTVEDAVPLFRGNLLFKLVLRKLTSSSTMNSELTLQGYQEFNDASAVPYQSVRLVSPRLSKVFGQDLLEIYPNPTQGLVHVQVKSEVSAVVSFHLLDLAGKLIRVLTKDQSLNTGLHHFDFDLSDLATGQYMIQGISDHPSLRFVKRIHINR